MKKMIVPFISAMTLVFSFTSCGKENVETSPTKQALLAHTWQMEMVTEYVSGVPHTLYQRGAANNEDDYSNIRQTYKSNGSIQFVDDFGDSGSNASYQLLDNDTKIRISYAGLVVTGENLLVTGNQFAYTLKFNGTDSTRFMFSPL
jgi:hypothetical protein